MLFAETIHLGSQQPVWQQIAIILIAIFACIYWIVFIRKTKKTIRSSERLQDTVEDQQKMINDLKRELEEMKKNLP